MTFAAHIMLALLRAIGGGGAGSSTPPIKPAAPPPVTLSAGRGAYIPPGLTARRVDSVGISRVSERRIPSSVAQRFPVRDLGRTSGGPLPQDNTAYQRKLL